MKEMLLNARNARDFIANMDEKRRNAALWQMASDLRANESAILEANKIDIENAKDSLPSAALARLKLDSAAISAMARAIEDIAQLKNPLGRVLDGFKTAAGLQIYKVSVPIGIIAVIYESRPNVTSDVGALCFKSGNVCILKGGKEALHSNTAILRSLHESLDKCAIPRAAINLIAQRESVESLLKEDKIIDLVIPRGGESLINFVSQNTRIPVLKHDKGVCHLYLHSDCARDKAIEIALNAKISKPSACNSVETILVHKDCKITGEVISALKNAGVTIRALEKDAQILGGAESLGLEIAQESNFYNEYGANTLNFKIVNDENEAIAHIAHYGSHHSDAIITEDYGVANAFVERVDSACVFVNASTRFSDGGEFGYGAEVGISTSKIHARGPMGIESLTSYKYKIYGNGEVRK